MVLVSFVDGADVDTLVSDLRRTFVEVDRPAIPSSVDNLDELGSLPWTVAAFLALLATLASVHALVMAVRAWRRDLAVLRALGLVPRQARTAVRWQALTVAVVGLLTGIPLGLAVARPAWAAVADALGVVNERIIPWYPMAAVAAVTLLAAAVLAIPPGVAAARTRLAEVLRAE